MSEEKVVKCPDCGKDVNKSDGCDYSHIRYNGKEYERVKYESILSDSKGRCHDCGAKDGEYHHFFGMCDMEKCPICGLQFISCDCLQDEVVLIDKS